MSKEEYISYVQMGSWTLAKQKNMSIEDAASLILFKVLETIPIDFLTWRYTIELLRERLPL